MLEHLRVKLSRTMIVNDREDNFKSSKPRRTNGWTLTETLSESREGELQADGWLGSAIARFPSPNQRTPCLSSALDRSTATSPPSVLPSPSPLLTAVSCVRFLCAIWSCGSSSPDRRSIEAAMACVAALTSSSVAAVAAVAGSSTTRSSAAASASLALRRGLIHGNQVVLSSRRAGACNAS